MKDDLQGPRERARAALCRATEGLEPDLSGLLDGVPRMQAEALRRQRVEVRAGGIAVLVPLASRVIPRMALVTLALVLISTWIFLREPAPSQEVAEGDRSELDSWILSGAAEEGAVQPLLLAILSGGDRDG